jgi:hypothetical protein
MPAAIDTLFAKEQDLSTHLRDVGVLLLDISDSVKDKLSKKDADEVKDSMITLSMNCDAMLDDIANADKILKKIKTKDVSVKGTNADVASLKAHLLTIKEALTRLKKNANDFLNARDKELVFQEMNKDYADVLGTLTELMAESV